MNKKLIAFLFPILGMITLSSCQYFKTEEKIIVEEELSPGVDGIQKKYRKNKTLLATIEHRDKKRHGISRSYYDDGKTVHNEIRYNMGTKEGITNSYYRNAQLYYTVKYVEGKRDGILTKYYKTGKLLAEVPYDKGEAKTGLVEYKETGEIKKIYPEILFEEIDKTAFENKYIIRVKLTGGKKNVKFYRILYDRFGSEMGQKNLTDKSGVTEEVFYINEGGYINEKFTIKAVYTTTLYNPYVIYRTKQIKIDW